MTQDTTRVHDERNPGDTTVYGALWAAAPFPYLPEDAPQELERFTIEIEDPKRVYAIYKATRRHNFQYLLDRFIHQIRYGCICKTCNVTTCFSRRKRLANGAPVRRYNATSARTLALYMMSLDNPERALCHQTPATRPGGKSMSIKSKNLSLVDCIEPSSKDQARIKSATTAPKLKPSDVPRQELSTENTWEKEIEAQLANLIEPTSTDHKSFVQNLFETVAFKMTEWLTPSYLDRLAELRGGLESRPGASSSLTSENVSDYDAPELKPVNSENLQKQCDEVNEIEKSKFLQKKNFDVNPNLSATNLIFTDDKTSKHMKSNTLEQTDTLDNPMIEAKSKGKIVHEKPVSPNMCPLNEMREPLLKQGSIKSSQIHRADLESRESTVVSLSLNPLGTQIQSSCGPSTLAEKLGTDQSGKENTNPHPKENVPRASLTEVDPLPQSLNVLTIETIEFICNVLQRDGTFEKHNLHPQNVNEELKQKILISRTRNVLQRIPLLQNKNFYPDTAKQRWKAFIEQSLFDVLGKPVSLLQTFCDEDKKLFDSQTIWYLMLQLTRSAPTLVLNSLWNAAGALFRPPRYLEIASQIERDFKPQKLLCKRAVSSTDAARVVNICLHALIAASPLVDDVRQFGYVSQLRTSGLATLARESTPEAVTLCLQYEDIFTDGLAIRLARRIFAAIPTRRRFSELLEFQGIQKSQKREPDILETILSTFEYFNPSSQPTLVFSESDRIIHKERVPSLILDWARAVMLHEWNGSATVPPDGPFAGALATIDAIYKNRNSLLLDDVHFRTEYFAEHLDSVDMPIEWLTFDSNTNTIHLLDYPYLFNPATLITYFRAINFSKMNFAYEAAKSEHCRMTSNMHEHSLMVDRYSRDKLQERLRIATTKFMVMEIRRTHILLDTFNSIWRREERELMRPLKLRLGEEGGEEGSDSGGVQQEYLRLAISEALNPDYGTFTVDKRTRMTWFQPGSPEPLWKYELIGMIISLAIYNGLTLPVTFPKALYMKLLGEEITELHHIMDGWPDLVNGLTVLLEWDEKDGLVEDIFSRTYEFSVEQFGKPVTREMTNTRDDISTWPQFSALARNVSSSSTDAPLVTKKNRKNYVDDYIRYLTDVSIRPQFTAFKNGFFRCISRRSVTLFDAMTLQSLVEGIQEISIAELRDTTRYVGWDGDANHHTIRDFWSIVMKYNMDMRRKLLEFVTASDRVPVGGMCGVQFTIQKNGYEDRMLPTSYTCYGILLLPEYSKKEVLESRLAMALENSKGFGFA